LRKLLVFALFASGCCLAGPTDGRLPTLGLLIAAETDIDVLGAITPVLDHQSFTELAPREISREHLPVVIFKNAYDDELQVVVGHRCVLLEFNGAFPGADPSVAFERFKAIHDMLEQYFLSRPEARLRIQSEIPIPAGCPKEF
jgi:hypothetical protein